MARPERSLGDRDEKEHQTLSEQPGYFSEQSRWEDLSPEAREALKIRTLDALGCAFGALDFTLGPEQLARLDEASKIDLGFPHDFLVQARSYIFGKTYPLIDDHRL